MNAARRAVIVAAALLVALAVGSATAGAGSAAGPEWSDDVFERLETAAAEYNAQDAEVGIVERQALRNARVNLHVRDEAGAKAVYALRFDGDSHVTQLRREPFEEPTVRAETTRATVERISAAEDPAAAVRQAVWNRQIRLERVIDLFGVQFRIGLADGLAGAGGVVVASIVVAKFGIKPVMSAVWRPFNTVFRTLRAVWRRISRVDLGRIVTFLTILQQLNLLGPLRRRAVRLWKWLRKRAERLWRALRDAATTARNPFGGSSTEQGRDDERG